MLVLCLCVISCNYPRKLSPSDLADAPQSERRKALREDLSSLTFLPAVSASESIREVVRAPIYSVARDVAVLVAPSDCRSLGDTCLKSLRIYSWDTAAHTYHLQDSLTSRGLFRLANLDLTRDGKDDLVLYTSTGRSQKTGMQIVGIDRTTHRLVRRFQSDTILPSVVRLNDRGYALLEYDSIYAKRLTGIPLRIPKRFYRLFEEAFLESPADPSWAQLVQHVRDSTHQMFLLSRDEMSRQTHPDAGLQRAFISAAVSEALLDSSWAGAQWTVQRLLGEFTSKLSSANYNALLRFSLEDRAGAFVRQSLKLNPQIVAAAGDWDDAVFIRDTNRARTVLSQALRTLKASDLFYRMSSSAVSHSLLIADANQALLRASELDQRNAQILRLRAKTFTMLGQEDSSRALLFRSLQLDSTSSEAFSIRQSLGY